MSLGWCFWHRGCLGCLICSQPININEDLLMLDEELPPSSAKTGNRMKDQMEEVRGGRLGRKRKAQAIELDEVPVCHACDAMLVETGAHRDEVGMFLAREHVGQRDGGLGKQRWKMLRGTGTSEAVDAEKQESSKARRMAREFESEVARSNSNVSRLSVRLLPDAKMTLQRAAKQSPPPVPNVATQKTQGPPTNPTNLHTQTSTQHTHPPSAATAATTLTPMNTKHTCHACPSLRGNSHRRHQTLFTSQSWIP